MNEEKFVQSILRAHKKAVRKKLAQEDKESQSRRLETIKSSLLHIARLRTVPTHKTRRHRRPMPYYLLKQHLKEKGVKYPIYNMLRQLRKEKAEEGDRRNRVRTMLSSKILEPQTKTAAVGDGNGKETVVGPEVCRQCLPLSSFAFRRDDFITQLLTGEISVYREHAEVPARTRRQRGKRAQGRKATRKQKQAANSVSAPVPAPTISTDTSGTQGKPPRKRRRPQPKVKKQAPARPLPAKKRIVKAESAAAGQRGQKLEREQEEEDDQDVLSEADSLLSFIVNDDGEDMDSAMREELECIKRSLWRNSGLVNYDDSDSDIPEAGFDAIQREEKKAERLGKSEDRAEARKEREGRKRKKLDQDQQKPKEKKKDKKSAPKVEANKTQEPPPAVAKP